MDNDEPLPVGWSKQYSNTWKKPYYFNIKTGKQVWEHPGTEGGDSPAGSVAGDSALHFGGLNMKTCCPGSGSPARPQSQAAAGGREQTLTTNLPVASTDLRSGNNILQNYEDQHPWAFGAFAELIQNSDDAGARRLDINFEEYGGVEFLEFRDNGKGMSNKGMEFCFTLGDSRLNRSDDDRISGQYGVGFKQGFLRLGHTAVVISRSEEEATISFGVLSNKPFRDENNAPLCVYTTLDLQGKDLDGERPQSVVSDTIVGMVKMENLQIWLGIHLGRRMEGSSGTTVFIFGVRERVEEYKDTQIMQVEKKEKTSF
jgi:hypothetical protein